jgi:hypothetical protein
MQLIHTSKQTSGGYILLLSVLVVSIILAISFSIYSISIKEVILSSYLRDSQQAFAVADRGLECVLEWDVPYRTPLDYHGVSVDTFRWTIFATTTVVTDGTWSGYHYPPEFALAQVSCGLQQLLPAGTPTHDTATRPTANVPCATPIGPTQWCVEPSAGGMKTQFMVDFGNNTCAYITVFKNGAGTKIRSDGVNDCNPLNPRRTQRSIEVNTTI